MVRNWFSATRHGKQVVEATALRAVSRLANRSALGVNQARIERLAVHAEGSWLDAVNSVMTEAAVDDEPPVENAEGTDTDWATPIWWWLDQMAAPSSGLTDRMAWFWHNLLTTNAQKVSTVPLLAEQLHVLRTLGRSDFRSLLHGFVATGAVQEYLDGSHSQASNPNENLGRELMELFTVGNGHYDEFDVKAAARALAGWVVADGELLFRRENAFIAPLVFMDEQALWDTTSIVDRLCDHPATPARIAARLWTHLVGTELAATDAEALGSWWASEELNIDPLIERILLSPDFLAPASVRARSGVEWFCAARAATGAVPNASNDINWSLWSIGQMPYHPPNVSGWGDRWLEPGSLLGRTASIWSILDRAGLNDQENPSEHPIDTDTILARCGLTEASATTRAALNAVKPTDQLTEHNVRHVRWRLALASPEFNLL